MSGNEGYCAVLRIEIETSPHISTESGGTRLRIVQHPASTPPSDGSLLREPEKQADAA